MWAEDWEFQEWEHEAQKADWEENLIKNNAPEFCHECAKIFVEHTPGGSECMCQLTEKNPPVDICECPLYPELLP